MSHAIWSDFCAVPPSPELREKWKAELGRLKSRTRTSLAGELSFARKPRMLGFDDGVIIPPEEFPLGTSMAAMQAAAASRAPLRGLVRVVVVLVQFSDRAMAQPVQRFEDLFFSTGVLPHGSVREYFHDVTGGLVQIGGQVVGPYEMPQTLAWYANANFGIGKGGGAARANILAQDAARAADPDVDFGQYDNDNNGYVDAFIVVHAGRGGEETGASGDIWSHKWTLPSAFSADGKRVYAYLTIPEDAKLGVCAHELGHLLFGFPDLYDTDYTSEGIGNWCLMAGGSWNGGGDVPAHPSAWCKANQGWVSVTNVTASGSVTVPDVKTSRNVLRLWKDGMSGPEYFLVENRQRTGFDAHLPGDGLLVWHIDENQGGNTDENHYKVALEQADGKRDLELDRNRGDAGDPFPGSANVTSFGPGTTPNSRSYGGQDTCVAISSISPSGATMTANVTVTCGKAVAKDLKDAAKERKESLKDLKDRHKDLKERAKDLKDLKERPKELKELKEGAKELKDGKELVEWPPGGWRPYGFAPAAGDGGDDLWSIVADLEARVAALEAAAGGGGVTAEGPGVQPFIGEELRPDLLGGPGVPGTDLEQRMAAGDASAKREFDAPPPRG